MRNKYGNKCGRYCSEVTHTTMSLSWTWIGRALYSKWKVGACASACCLTLCVYIWVHFVTIATMCGNLFSGRPSKVLPWSWRKSLGLGLETQSLGLGLEKHMEVLALVLVLTKKSYLHHWLDPSMDWAGLDWIGLDWIGSGFSGNFMYWIGLVGWLWPR